MTEELYSMLDAYWQKTVDELIQSLKDVDRYSSGNTAQLIGFGVTMPAAIENGNVVIQLNMPNYYEYIDEGVSGAKNNKGISRFSFKDKGKGEGGRGQKGIPPAESIRQFMVNRSIVPKHYAELKRGGGTKAEKKKNIDEAFTSLAYAISYKIWENGFDPTNFYSNVVNDAKLKDFETKLLAFNTQFVISVIQKI